MDFEVDKIFIQQQKLMKKSIFLIISFFLFFIADMVLFIILQKNSLFMFNINRSEENMPNPFVTDIFATIFYTIILVSLVIYVIYLVIILNKTYRANQLVMKRINSFADLFSIVPIFLFVLIIFNGFFITLGQVDGESMEPNFYNNDAVVISYNTNISRRDVIIVKYDGNFLIKRVVGIPGDNLRVDETGVYINDDLIESFTTYTAVYYDLVIPEGSYYLLGDNRLHSLDSRSIGLFEEEDVLGEVIYNLS